MPVPFHPHRVGTFLKSHNYQQLELLEGSGVDFVVIDAEHAPFDRAAIDMMMVAGRAVSIPIHVRVPDREPSSLLSVLDMGASGLVIPHVDTADDARNVIAEVRYVGGRRGYSGSPRSSGFGDATGSAAIERAKTVEIMCQIESAAGIEEADAIAAVEGISGLFIGRADLAMATGMDTGSAEWTGALNRIAGAAHAHRKRLGLFVADASELAVLDFLTPDWIIIGSDQSFMRRAALAAVAAARSALQNPQRCRSI